jgi:hypothetical protein
MRTNNLKFSEEHQMLLLANTIVVTNGYDSRDHQNDFKFTTQSYPYQSLSFFRAKPFYLVGLK